jgi:hypothetical protein
VDAAPNSDGVDAAPPNSEGVETAPKGELELAGVAAAPNSEPVLCGWPNGDAGVDAPVKLNAEELAAGVAKLKVEPAALLLAPPKLNAIWQPCLLCQQMLLHRSCSTLTVEHDRLLLLE